MKTLELFESGRLKGGIYQLPYTRITPRDRGWATFYNYIVPSLARTFDIPTRNFKVTAGTWSTERVTLSVKITSSKTEIEMLELMMPKALKTELERTFDEVNIKSSYLMSTPGKKYPDLIITFTTKFPQKWIDLFDFDFQQMTKAQT
jgi:hypothetical protein